MWGWTFWIFVPKKKSWFSVGTKSVIIENCYFNFGAKIQFQILFLFLNIEFLDTICDVSSVILEKPRKKFEIYTLQQSCEYSDGNFATFRRARHIKKVKTPLYIKVKSCPHFLRVSNTIIKFKKSMFASLWKKFTKVRDRRQIFFCCCCLQFHTQVCAIEIVV